MLTEKERQWIGKAYEKYTQRLLVYSFSMLRSLPDAYSLAEDCVQETFVIAMKKIKTLIRHDSPEGWLMSTCRKVTLSKWRKMLRREEIIGKRVLWADIDVAEDDRNPIEEWILQNDLLEVKSRLADSLTEQESDVFRLYYEESLPLKACAKKLGLSETAVRGTIQRIRAKLSRLILLLIIFLPVVYF